MVFDTIEVDGLGNRKMVGCYCVECRKEFYEDYQDNLMQYEALMSAEICYGSSK